MSNLYKFTWESGCDISIAYIQADTLDRALVFWRQWHEKRFGESAWEPIAIKNLTDYAYAYLLDAMPAMTVKAQERPPEE